MIRFMSILLVTFLFGCISKSRDKIIDFNGVTPDEGIKYLNAIEERSAGNPDILYKRASLYFELGQYDKALLDVNRSLDIEESNADYVYLAGRINQKLGLSERSIEQLLLAEGLGLHNNLLYQSLAEEYLKTGKSKEAKLAIERLIGLNKNSITYSLAGQIALNLGDTSLAEQYYKESVKHEPNASSLSALSDIYNHQGQLELAGEYVNKALNIKPDDMADLHKKAKILIKLNKSDSAKGVYHKIIAQDSIQSLYYYELAQIYYSLYKYDSAQRSAEKALSLKPMDIEAKMLLARVLDKTTDYNRAISSYEAILKQDSTFNLARVELENLQRKVAYLRRLNQQKRALDSARNNAPMLIDRKGIEN